MARYSAITTSLTIEIAMAFETHPIPSLII